ncbi:hypothetical protein [Parvicella tangerina]|uniref:Lipoprotein n=1 Tax=Parvicella tangerina TaxID=2829795 RepID=A0A916JM71_9FLAO|nr:hypothetical protein [Parvicella tangerina]CAG5081015.1 hypothetical protein CRYO30217_01513 [Parvicella tangerina]
MKKFILFLMSLSLLACGSTEVEGDKSESAYYISIDDKVAETNNESDVGFMSDNIAGKTEFTLNGVKLTVKKMATDFSADPKSIEGKQYKGLVEKGESTHCSVTIVKVTELESDDMKTDYVIEGKLKTIKDEGKFKVVMFKMND